MLVTSNAHLTSYLMETVAFLNSETQFNLPVEGLLGKGYHVLNYAKKNLLTEQISLK
jgi:hypothetical protein